MKVFSIRISPGFTFAVVFAVLLIFGCVHLENGRILDNGAPAEAKILKYEHTGRSYNDMPVLTFYLEVYPPNKTPFRAETTAAVPMMNAHALQPGNRVKVKYMPDTNKVAIIGTR